MVTIITTGGVCLFVGFALGFCAFLAYAGEAWNPPDDQ